MILYSMVVIPWRICYKQDASGAMRHFDFFVDGVFGVDIVICFTTAYFEEVTSIVAEWDSNTALHVQSAPNCVQEFCK